MAAPNRYPIYDLQRLAERLDSQGRHANLCKAIRLGYNVASGASDLWRARNYLALIERLQESGSMPDFFSHEEGGSLIEALFLSAVVVYARATDVKTKARQPWWGPDKLNPEMAKTHSTIMTLRNKEFAHFGKGLVVGDEPLLSEVLYVAPTDYSINFRATNWATQPEFVVRMIALVDEVRRSAAVKQDKCFGEIADEIARRCQFDNSLGPLIESLPVADPKFEHRPAADRGFDKGFSRSWTSVNSRPLGIEPT